MSQNVADAIEAVLKSDLNSWDASYESDDLAALLSKIEDLKNFSNIMTGIGIAVVVQRDIDANDSVLYSLGDGAVTGAGTIVGTMAGESACAGLVEVPPAAFACGAAFVFVGTWFGHQLWKWITGH